MIELLNVQDMNPGRGAFAKPPPSTAEAFPEWLGWCLVLIAIVVAFWLWSITPKARSKR